MKIVKGFPIIVKFISYFLRKKYGIQKRHTNVIGMGLTYIYGLVLTQLTFHVHALTIVFLQNYQENFGLETVFNIWWRGKVIESLCRWKDFYDFLKISSLFLFTKVLDFSSISSFTWKHIRDSPSSVDLWERSFPVN